MPHKFTWTSFLVAVVVSSSFLQGGEIQTLDNKLPVPQTNTSSQLRRFKRAGTPQKGFFFPIAMYTVRHHKPAQERGRDVHPETWEYKGQYFYGYKPKKTNSRKRTARLLAAGLPLLLAPLLSIIFSFPVLVPITQMTQMGGTLLHPLLMGKKRKKRAPDLGKIRDIPDKVQAAKLKELEAVAHYLHKIDYNEHKQSRVMVNYLQCNGLLSPEDHCLERLSCEFGDPANFEAPELEKTVTSILLGHILNNEFIPKQFIRRLKSAAVFGKNHSGKCLKYYCSYVDDNMDFTSVHPSSGHKPTPKTKMRPPVPKPRNLHKKIRPTPNLPKNIQRI